MPEIVTIEGLRQCVEVKRGKGGECRCARMGRSGEGRPFPQLCKEAGFKMLRIGGHPYSVKKALAKRGLSGLEDNMAGLREFEYPDIEELEAFDAIDFVDVGKRYGIAGAAGGAGVVATEFIFSKLVKEGAPLLPNWVASLIQAVLGVGGGYAIERYAGSAPAGYGFAGGLIGHVAYKLAKEPLTLGQYEEEELEQLPPEELEDIEIRRPELSDVAIREERMLGAGMESFQTYEAALHDMANLGTFLT